MHQQTTLCIAEMVKWAHSKDMSATILDLVPGEEEMEEIVID